MWSSRRSRPGSVFGDTWMSQRSGPVFVCVCLYVCLCGLCQWFFGWASACMCLSVCSCGLYQLLIGWPTATSACMCLSVCSCGLYQLLISWPTATSACMCLSLCHCGLYQLFIGWPTVTSVCVWMSVSVCLCGLLPVVFRLPPPVWGRGNPFSPCPFTSSCFALFYFSFLSLALTICFFCPSLSFLPE